MLTLPVAVYEVILHTLLSLSQLFLVSVKSAAARTSGVFANMFVSCGKIQVSAVPITKDKESDVSVRCLD